MKMYMIIVQMFPVAVTCGNTFILKPSEKDPGDCFLLISVVSGRLNSLTWSLMLNKMDKGNLYSYMILSLSNFEKPA
jgi:hypothetical protein